MYLKCDVLLKADLFKKMKNDSLKMHRLFPSHLKARLFEFTKFKLECNA